MGSSITRAYAACCSSKGRDLQVDSQQDQERLLQEGKINEDSSGNYYHPGKNGSSYAYHTRVPGSQEAESHESQKGKSGCCSGRCCAIVCCSICCPLLLVVIPFPFIMYMALNNFQIWALSHPGNPISGLYLPWIELVEGLWACDPVYVPQLQASYGDNFAVAGQVVISSFAETKSVLLAPQARTNNLGTQPLIASHFPNLDTGGRNLFLLSLSDKDAGGDGTHAQFRSSIMNYLFNEDNLARRTDQIATGFKHQLVKDYNSMPHGVDEEFFTRRDKGLFRYIVKMLHYVLLDMDMENEDLLNKLMDWYYGDSPIAHYLWPFGYLVNRGGLIEEIAKLYTDDSPTIRYMVPGPEYGNMDKYELAKMTTQIFRIAGVTGTLQLAQTALGGRKFPNYLNEDTASIDILKTLDALDLNSRDVLKGYILEAGRLYPPVSTSHHVATEEFTVEFEGKGEVTFPKGTKKLITMGAAMLDKVNWGENAYELDPFRNQNDNMIFNGVGDSAYSRLCPGKGLVMEMLTDVLQAIGQARRAETTTAAP
eukprot:gb/GFBE01007622.1/.p1 GENE.gb/GFBE01007622.1/~~gb/GFBE01007622.1/.p1  ORF type:complete len:538 (+),score=103.23 gb/GFBE01007622.1/:1-1614(+)